MYTKNSNGAGPDTEPCRTPQDVTVPSEIMLTYANNCMLV